MGGFIIEAAVVVGLIVLQVYLSGRKNKWFGLVLPVIFVLMSVAVAGMRMSPNVTVEAVDAERLAEELTLHGPAVVVTVIYVIRRVLLKRRVAQERLLDKMNIEDL